MTQRWVLDEIVDPFGARVIVERDGDGRARAARFDLAGLPRVDSLLLGRPVRGVPSLVERLCGICPAAHHLAGIRALEALAGAGALTSTAAAVRRLLHHGSAVDAHAMRLLATDRQDAVLLRGFARAVITAAGSPGHFPTTAVPGGVAAPVSKEARDELAHQVQALVQAAYGIARRLLVAGRTRTVFTGADVALADASGIPDLLGDRLRVVAADGTVIEPAARAERWDEIVAEEIPGDPAPRPYLVARGPEEGRYRVGPVAQLRVGRLTTPVSAELQTDWLTTHGDARAARAIMTVHSMEAIGQLLDQDALVSGSVTRPAGRFDRAAVGVGWVDGPRGLLVHRYATAADGTVVAATILTPTAQNEPWLAELLRQAADASPADARSTEFDMEDAVREADPCLPCSSAPAGAMGLLVETTAPPAYPQTGSC